MRYVTPFTVLLIALALLSVTTSVRADTPTPTASATLPAPTDTPSATEMATEAATDGPTATATPDLYRYVSLPSGKSGAIVYSITAGELVLIAFGTVILMLIAFDLYLRVRQK